MPQLDGILATSMIRKFDNITPIVSMTANLDPDLIISCPPAGMNDVLPKPFTKVSLGTVLERHLSHLKVIQRKVKVPRSLGTPRLSDTGVDRELVVAVQQPQQRERDARHQQAQDLDDEGGDALAKTNPLLVAGMGPMGMSDEEYVDILQHMASAGDFQPEQGDVGAVGRRGFVASEATAMGVTGTVVGRFVEKRVLEDSSDDRRGKRRRFEVIE